MKIGSSSFRQPLDRDTPEEFVNFYRSSPINAVRQFRIGEFDAVHLRESDGKANENGDAIQLVTFELNDEWVALFLSKTSSYEIMDKYEPSIVAVLESINLQLEAGYTAFPFFIVELPQRWEAISGNFNDNKHNITLASSDNPQLLFPRIFIYVEKLEGFALENGGKDILETVIPNPRETDFETQIVTIDDYKVLASNPSYITTSLGLEGYQAITITFIQQDWVFVAVAESPDEEDIPIMMEDIRTIITNMEITLPDN